MLPLVFHLHGDARGFRFFAEQNNETYEMGDTVNSGGRIKFNVSVPSDDVNIRLIHNGNLIASSENPESVFQADDKGVFRVEVYHNGKAWIY